MTVCLKGRINRYFFYLFTALILFSACRKNENTVGDDFIGSIVGFDVRSVDTSTLVAYTALDDSITTQNSNYYLIGEMYDPDFGKSNAAVITQYQPTPLANWDNKKATIDSIVLQIKYLGENSYYGNKTSSQTINVYEISEDLKLGTKYYSNASYAYNKLLPIGTWVGNFSNLADSVKYTFAGNNVSLPPHLRIRLDNPSYVQKFNLADASVFATPSNFQSYFKGLIIIPETNPLTPGNGAIVNVDLRNDNRNTNSITSVVVYYDTVQKIEFPLYGDGSVKTNKFTHEHSIIIPIQPTNGGLQKDINYVKSMAGLKTRILIPNIFDFVKTQNIAINGAELIIPIDGASNTGIYAAPNRLFLFDTDSLGRTSPNEILDFNFVTGYNSYYDGAYNSTTKSYSFNIMRHIQNILTKYKNGINVNYGLSLFVPANNLQPAGRSILNTSSGKIKLKLSYTVIK